MSLPVLSLEDARLTLQANAGPVEILRGITLAVAEGETIGLIGPSGSGKSSLLMLMGGLERATGGRVLALGQDFTAMSEDELARFRLGRMGVVFQSFHLIPTMTALENVATPLELAGRRDAFQRAEEELVSVGLGKRLHHYPAQLSGGEQQRVALARAAAPRPAILLADEPTGNLDGPNGEAIMDLLFGLRDRHGATLVLVTHSPELAARCDRVVVLRDGRIEQEIHPGSAADSPASDAPTSAAPDMPAAAEAPADPIAEATITEAPAKASKRRADPAPSTRPAKAPPRTKQKPASKLAKPAASRRAATAATSAATSPAPATASAFEAPPAAAPQESLPEPDRADYRAPTWVIPLVDADDREYDDEDDIAPRAPSPKPTRADAEILDAEIIEAAPAVSNARKPRRSSRSGQE